MYKTTYSMRFKRLTPEIYVIPKLQYINESLSSENSEHELMSNPRHALRDVTLSNSTPSVLMLPGDWTDVVCFYASTNEPGKMSENELW